MQPTGFACSKMIIHPFQRNSLRLQNLLQVVLLLVIDKPLGDQSLELSGVFGVILACQLSEVPILVKSVQFGHNLLQIVRQIVLLLHKHFFLFSTSLVFKFCIFVIKRHFVI